MNSNPNDLKTMMERYERELMAMRQQAVPVVSVTESQPAPPPQVELPEESNGPITATLQVRVTAANETLPIANALVVIRRKDAETTVPEQIRLTDISGLTEPVVLSATDPALTMQPQDNIPLVLYDIEVAAPGYYRVLNRDVPLFGGIPTVQPVSMIPLPEFEEPNRTELEFTVPRNSL